MTKEKIAPENWCCVEEYDYFKKKIDYHFIIGSLEQNTKYKLTSKPDPEKKIIEKIKKE